MSSVKVAVRVRPFNKREIEAGSSLIIRMNGNKTAIINPNAKPDLLDSSTSSAVSPEPQRIKEFTYDYSYWSFDNHDSEFANQEQVYNDLGKEVVQDSLQGYNACVFAYGQTGSGKTYTMMGTPDEEGLIPRICEELFARMKQGRSTGSTFRAEVSYLEIYNEKVKDLLTIKAGNEQGLKVREHPKLGPYVQDLSKHLVMDYSDVQELMARGNSHRTTAATGMNDTSSRSHAIFTMTFNQASFSSDTPRETLSKVNLVDLAGSERANATGATGQRLKEGGHINKSLVTLGSVIKALAESSVSSPVGSSRRSTFIPYRDSVLTWLLKDSLGGNSKTVMIATISPADCNYSETLSTLRYSNRAKSIMNKPTINEDTNTKLIRDLRSEIERLKSLIIDHPTMISKVHENEARVKMLTEEWTEKWKETHKILSEQRTLGLRKAGLGIVLDSELPHLVGIDDDLLSTGITLYHLRDGETRIGTEFSDKKQDIILHGLDVEDEHCVIELKDGVANLIPLQKSLCSINTIEIDKPTKLSQGCVILLGRNNLFRYNDPIEVNKLRRERENGSCLNLSKVFSKSCDFAKSVDNLWSPVPDPIDECDDHLEEKRRQIEELEEEHKRAEERRKEEELRANEELTSKKVELEKLREEREALESKVKETQLVLQLLQEEQEKLTNYSTPNKSFIGDALSSVTQKTDEVKFAISNHLNMMKDYDDAGVQNKSEDLFQNIYDKLAQDIEQCEYSIKTKNVVAQTLIPEPLFVDVSLESNEYRCSNEQAINQKNLEYAGEDSNTNKNTHNIPHLKHIEPISKSVQPPTLMQELDCLQLKIDSLANRANELDVDSLTITNNNHLEPMSLPLTFPDDNLSTLKSVEKSIDKRMNELRRFESQLANMEQKLNEQRSLFELQRNKELDVIKNEKEKLKELEEEAEIEVYIEKEVQRRVQASLREDRDTRVNNYYRLTASPSIGSLFSGDESALNAYEPWSINIPSFFLCGSGTAAHFEYKIVVTVNGESWTLYRRYRRFRDLHQSVIRKYNDQVVCLPYFPPRIFIGNKAPRVAQQRRSTLQYYLRELVGMLQDIQNSPLNWRQLGQQRIEKDNFYEFSTFFRSFDSGINSFTG